MPAPSGNGGGGAGAVIATFLFSALLLALTWNALSGWWDSLVENKGPGAWLACGACLTVLACRLESRRPPTQQHVPALLGPFPAVLVVLGLLIVWLNTRNGDDGSSLAASPAGPGASGRGQLTGPVPRRRDSPASLPTADSGSGRGSGGSSGRLHHEGSGGGSSGKTLMQREDSASGGLGTAAATRKVQGSKGTRLMEMVNLGAPASAISGSGSGSSTALVPASDMSGALAKSERPCLHAAYGAAMPVPRATAHLRVLACDQGLPMLPLSCPLLSLQPPACAASSRRAAASAMPAPTLAAAGSTVTGTAGTACPGMAGAVAGNGWRSWCLPQCVRNTAPRFARPAAPSCAPPAACGERLCPTDRLPAACVSVWHGKDKCWT